MDNVIPLPDRLFREIRQCCVFKNRPVLLRGEDGNLKKYPCIVLYEKETDIPVYYTGLERYLCPLNKGEMLEERTLSIRAYAVCHFLNFLLQNTNLRALHECSLDTLRAFLKSMRKKPNGASYNKDTWMRYGDYLTDFLILYYESHREELPFQYSGGELKSAPIPRNERGRTSGNIVRYAPLHIAAPKTTHKKNRILVNGYLELLLYEAKKYDPDIVLGIALGAYAGLREGEVVNVSYGSVKILRKGFGAVAGIEIDLTETAPFFLGWEGKTNPGAIKKNRRQRVYPDFATDVSLLYEQHKASMEERGADTGPDAPVFINKHGSPMTVQTYSGRVKSLFYQRFLPTLKLVCERQGTYGDNAAFIDAYTEEYPGAHMFRHWFTMYLLTKAGLTSGEIMKWRGDSSQESMNDYIHENADMIRLFRDTSYTFQSRIIDAVIREDF